MVSQAVRREAKWDGTVPGSWDEGALEGREGELGKGIRIEFGGSVRSQRWVAVEGTLQASDLLKGGGQ